MNFIILCTSDGEQPALFLGAASQLKSIWGRSCLDLICTEGSLHWGVTATTGFCFYWSFQLVGSMPAGVSVWFPFWNQLLESVGFASGSCCLWKPPGRPGEGTLGSQTTGWCCASPASCCEGANPRPELPLPQGGCSAVPSQRRRGLLSSRDVGRREVFLGQGDPRAAEVPVDALQSWLHPDTRHRVPFCSQTFKSQCQVVLCYVMLLCYAGLC